MTLPRNLRSLLALALLGGSAAAIAAPMAGDLPRSSHVNGDRVQSAKATTGGFTRARTGGMAIVGFNYENLVGGYSFDFGPAGLADGSGTVITGIGSDPGSSESPMTWQLRDGVITVYPATRLTDRAQSFEFDASCSCQVLVTFDNYVDSIILSKRESPLDNQILVRSTGGVSNSSHPHLVPNESFAAGEGTLATMTFADDLLRFRATDLAGKTLMLPMFDRQANFNDRFVAESVDFFTFHENGRGVTDREGLAFDWTLDGVVLDIAFQNGDRARYHRYSAKPDPKTFNTSAVFRTPEGRAFIVDGIDVQVRLRPAFAAATAPGRYHAFGVGTEGRPEGWIDEFIIEIRPDGSGDQVSIFNDEQGVVHESRSRIAEWDARFDALRQRRTQGGDPFRVGCALTELNCGIGFRRTWTPVYANGERLYVLETIQGAFTGPTGPGVDVTPVNYRWRLYERTPLP